jgi:hypothetical protein
VVTASASGASASDRSRVRTWPLLLLALPAFVAIWSGWVGLGELTGFGPVDLLPGIWSGARINSAITLPIGMETYAAYALAIALSGTAPAGARRFARWSAVGSLVLGAAGQIAYHLMTAAGVTRAPWQITALVACLPVAVLGMGVSLAHLVRGPDADAVDADVRPDAVAPVAVEVVRPVSTGASGRTDADAPQPALPVAPPDADADAPVRTDPPDADADAAPVARPRPVAAAAVTDARQTATARLRPDAPVADAVDAVNDLAHTLMGTTDAELVARLRASGERSVRGAQRVLSVGRGRAQRILAIAWPDAEGAS